MAEVSWFLCCENFVVKENGMCDARDLLFELNVPQVPVVGKLSVNLAALWRSEDFQNEEPIQIRIGVSFSDGVVHPSSTIWTVSFESPQVLWYKKMTELYLQEYGFTSIILQSLEGGEWVTKASFPIMIIGG
jgi:hypothetical protein